MALRTPPLQPRSGFSFNWGNFATSADLPNASGNPLGAGTFGILEIGDTAYSVADGARYTCTAVGTVGGGDAVWASGGGGGGGGVLYHELYGTWDPTSTYTIPTGTDLDGNAVAFEIYCVVLEPLVRGVVSSLQTLMSSSGQFAGDGWELGYNGTRPRYVITDGAFTRLENFVGDFPLSLTQVRTLGFYSFGHDGATRFLKQAGSLAASNPITGFQPSTLGVALGVHASLATAADALTTGTILAMGAKTDGILSDADHRELVREFLLNGDLPDSTLTSRWSIRGLTAGAAPASIPDQIGTNDFTRVGAGTLFVRPTMFGGVTQVEAS